jgi:hypothetical protein
MNGVNDLVGENLALVPEYRAETAARRGLGFTGDSAPARNIIPDGTEWTVALVVLGALGFLALLEIGGFKTVLAASVSTGR